MNSIKALWQAVHARFSEQQRRWMRRVAQWVVIAASVTYLAFNLRLLLTSDLSLTWRWPFLLFSWFSTLIALWLGATAWWLVLKGLGQPLGWIDAASIHLISNLAKYLPGYAWQIASKAYLTRQRGISTRLLSTAMLMEMFALLGSGTVLAAIVVKDASLGFPSAFSLFVLIAGTAVFLGLLGLPFLWPYLATHLRLPPMLQGSCYALAILAMVAGWIWFAVSFWALAAALVPLSMTTWPLFLFSTVGSFLISLAVLFVPGGLGVRESTITFLLTPLLGAGIAALVATLSRLILVLSELSAAGLISWLRSTAD